MTEPSRSLDPDKGTAILAPVQGRSIVFRLQNVEFAALEPVDLPAFWAKPTPQFLLVDRQVAVTASKFLPLSTHEDQIPVAARIHVRKDIGSGSKKQTGNFLGGTMIDVASWTARNPAVEGNALTQIVLPMIAPSAIARLAVPGSTQSPMR